MIAITPFYENRVANPVSSLGGGGGGGGGGDNWSNFTNIFQVKIDFRVNTSSQISNSMLGVGRVVPYA